MNDQKKQLATTNKRNTLLVRLSPELHARLKVIADHEHRSMSAQVCHMIGAVPLPEGASIVPERAPDAAPKKEPWWKTKPLGG